MLTLLDDHFAGRGVNFDGNAEYLAFVVIVVRRVQDDATADDVIGEALQLLDAFVDVFDQRS